MDPMGAMFSLKIENTPTHSVVRAVFRKAPSLTGQADDWIRWFE